MTLIALCVDGPPVPDTDSDCPNRAEHTPAPTGYTAWHAWAARMHARGARQLRCGGCGLYKLWTTPALPDPTPRRNRR